MNYSLIQKTRLDEIVLAAAMNPDFVRNPKTDFTRMRKLDFVSTFMSIINMEGGTLNNEIRKLFHNIDSRPTASALVQARDKIVFKAYKYVFDNFTYGTKTPRKYRKHRLIGVDGTSIGLFRNPNDTETSRSYGKVKSYNTLNIVTSYDLLNKLFLNAVIQPFNKSDERAGLIEMIESFPTNSIIIGDRGYESYNIFAHLCENKQKFVIRIKDINSNGILSGFSFPDGEFDLTVTLNITNSNKKIYKSMENHRYSPSAARFDFSDDINPVYSLTLRILRIKLDNGNYESLVTNLDESYLVDEIKELYGIRWGHETAYRELKYSVGMNNLHAKKRDSVIQEIYAKLTLYNLCSTIIQNTKLPNRATTHEYTINFCMTVKICRDLLKSLSTVHKNVEAEILRYLLPVRKNRSFKRSEIRKKGFTSFNFRIT